MPSKLPSNDKTETWSFCFFKMISRRFHTWVQVIAFQSKVLWREHWSFPQFEGRGRKSRAWSMRCIKGKAGWKLGNLVAVLTLDSQSLSKQASDEINISVHEATEYRNSVVCCQFPTPFNWNKSYSRLSKGLNSETDATSATQSPFEVQQEHSATTFCWRRDLMTYLLETWPRHCKEWIEWTQLLKQQQHATSVPHRGWLLLVETNRNIQPSQSTCVLRNKFLQFWNTEQGNVQEGPQRICKFQSQKTIQGN